MLAGCLFKLTVLLPDPSGKLNLALVRSLHYMDGRCIIWAAAGARERLADPFQRVFSTRSTGVQIPCTTPVQQFQAPIVVSNSTSKG
jgi:hypothetical protein